MQNVTLAVMLAIANLGYAAFIYLSLQPWFVTHDPGGLQLLMHFFVTAPLTIITSVWLYVAAKASPLSPKAWKLNLAGLLVPLMSMQTGVTYYHFDKIGLAVALLITAALIGFYMKAMLRHRTLTHQR